VNTATPAFASSGARIEHRPVSPGEMRVALGRVLRERIGALRPSRPLMTHETAGILHREDRARDALRASTERARVLIAHQLL